MSPHRFGGPHASESCSGDGLASEGQDGKEGSEADSTVAQAGTPPATAQKEGPQVEGGPGGRHWGQGLGWVGTQEQVDWCQPGLPWT